MFKQRLVASLVLIPLVLLLITLTPALYLALLMYLVVLGMAYEWIKLMPIQKIWIRISFFCALTAGILICPSGWSSWFGLCLLTWGLILAAVVTYPRSQVIWGQPAPIGIVCFIVLPVLFWSLCGIYSHENGKLWIVYLLCLVWSMDIGAYLIGKKLGAHHFIAQVSPGKTLEGLLGGVLFTGVTASVAGLYFKPHVWLYWIIFAVSIGLISVVGDLFMSMLKRRSGVKDTGALIPGHGGILDRLDSLIAAVPFFYVGLNGVLFNSLG
jgi:CDP-diglyceride synthetase